MLVGNSVYGQQCNCLSELQFLERNAEHNLPSYYDQVINQKREKLYSAHKNECNTIAKRITDNTECVYVVAKYLSFFRDEHLSVFHDASYYPFSWEKHDTSAISAFFQKEKKYPFPQDAAVSKDGIEGYWMSKDKKYIVKVIKNKSVLWEYIAVIIEGDKEFWSRGQLKFSLHKIGKNTYESIYLTPNRKPKMLIASLNKSELSIGRMNIFHRTSDTVVAPQDNDTRKNKLEFRELSVNTCYLSIPDFSYERHSAIDSIIDLHFKTIRSKPFLIIDVRNNGGGSDISYQSLLPLVMKDTSTPQPITSSYYCTPEILKHYIDDKYKHSQTRADSIYDDSTIALIQRYMGKYTPVEFDSIYVDSVYHYPLKVAIIVNRWCASSTEGFILTGRLSSKVKLYGEHTGGFLGYGNWRAVKMPCLPVSISMPTKKMFFRNNEDYESKGIPPNMILDPAQDNEWINQVQNDIEKK